MDLYAEALIPVGTPINVQNTGVVDVYLRTTNADPGTDRGEWQLCVRGQILRNLEGSIGEWAIAPNFGGTLEVWESEA